MIFEHSNFRFALDFDIRISDLGKAGDGNRTHITSLEGWSFATKLHPRHHCLFSIFDLQFYHEDTKAQRIFNLFDFFLVS